MSMKSYQLTSVMVNVFGAPITGFGKDDAISIEKLEDDINVVTGMDGETAVTYTNNQNYKVTITLLQTAAANALLQTLRGLGIGAQTPVIGPLSIIDTSGTYIFLSPNAVLQNPGTLDLKNEASDRKWVFVGSDTKELGGGN
jgi:Protein of unknown function (DUF3277)